MAKTIVGVFDDETSAQSAMRELQTAGVAPGHIRLTSNQEATSAKSSDPSWTDRVVGFFESLFEDESDHRHASTYAEAWRRGHFLIVADVDDRLTEKAVEIMNRHGTVDIDRRSEYWKKTGYTGTYDYNAKPYTQEQRAKELAEYSAETKAVPVVQEELAVGKQIVQRGGVRIHSYVKERPVEELVRLREERVNVSRRPVNRPAGQADAAFQERTVDVTAQGEEVVAEKRARVVEEVVVGKEVSEREQTVRDTVRRKDVEVEQIAGENIKGGANARPSPQDAPRR
jgi:uncharacterized protein (TIGR02271 family)